MTMSYFSRKFRRILQNIFNPFGANPLNDKYESRFDGSKKPIFVFYHVYAFNNWRDIFNEQMDSLILSGLYENINNLYVSVISNNLEDIDYIAYKIGPKGQIIFSGNNPKVYEFPSLIELRKVANSTDSNIMYFHTKGSSNSPETLKWYFPRVRSLAELRSCSRSWRKFMEYFVIEKWRIALSVLEDFDTYGCYFREQGAVSFYAGNFWWSTSEHIRKLKTFSEEDMKYRYSAETWLLGCECRMYDAFRLNADITGLPLPESLYISEEDRLKAFLDGVRFRLKYIIYSIRSKYIR